MTKVCHFTSTHNTTDQRIFHKECVSLSKNGYDVTVVGQGESKTIDGIKIIGTGETKKSAFYRLLIRPYKVYRLAKKQDAAIYQFHDMELIPYGNKLRRQGKTVIFDYHEDFASRFADSDVFHMPRFVMKILAAVYTHYEKRSIARYAAMISVTPHICERLAKYNSNTVMITNYPLIENYAEEDTASHYDANSNYIFFAGQISSYLQCIDTAVKAIQRFEDLSFEACGPERREGDIEALKALDKAKKFVYLGLLPFKEVPRKSSQALAALATCQYTKDTNGKGGTLGVNKLFEAMACGVPVICTDFEIWKKIVSEEKCGICVTPGDVQQLEKAIEYLDTHRQEAKLMGENGRQAVLKKYNWHTQEEILLTLYRRIKDE